MISYLFSVKPWLKITIGMLFMATVAVLSLMPSNELPGIAIYQVVHKVAHVCMYLGLSFISCWSFNISRHRMKPLYLMLASVFMYGVLMEILQRSMHNGRNFHFSDMIANLTGAIVGILIYRYFEEKHLSTEYTDERRGSEGVKE